jgi:hypothetical protein
MNRYLPIIIGLPVVATLSACDSKVQTTSAVTDFTPEPGQSGSEHFRSGNSCSPENLPGTILIQNQGIDGFSTPIVSDTVRLNDGEFYQLIVYGKTAVVFNRDGLVSAIDFIQNLSTFANFSPEGLETLRGLAGGDISNVDPKLRKHIGDHTTLIMHDGQVSYCLSNPDGFALTGNPSVDSGSSKSVTEIPLRLIFDLSRKSKNPVVYANLAAYTELGQETFYYNASTPQYIGYVEVRNNSIGWTMLLARAGYDYDSYVSEMASKRIPHPRTHELFELPTFTKEAYEKAIQATEVGPIIEGFSDVLAK